MLKKVSILTQFGTPHEWTEEYFKNIGKLGQYGFYWKIFTPNHYDNVPPNVEVVDMDINQFNEVMQNKLGYNSKNFITDRGVPSKPVSDYMVAHGVIFEDYIKGYDFWCMANWDVVYGRLDNFLPDDFLAQLDVFTDDVGIVNGVFSIFRNNERVNNLFQEIPNIKEMLCEHKLFGIDEYFLIDPIKKAAKMQDIVYLHPQYYPLHSYDRLEQHQPKPKLEIQPDGSLWELFRDINPPLGYVNFPKGYIGREIMYFHFNYTKKWPEIMYPKSTI